MSFTPAQAAFVASTAAFPAFVGGFGSGKTSAAIARIMRLKRLCPKQDVAYYLPTYGLVEDIAFQRFPAMFDRLGLAYKLNRQSATLQTDLGRIIFRTMDNPDRIVGFEVAHSILDELDTLPIEKARNVWNKVIARNRQKAFTASGKPVANSVAVSTTPEGFRFVHERWVKNKVQGYDLFRAKTMDNVANLPDGYIENLRNSYSSQLLAAYLEGEFCNLTAGSVYAEYDRALNASRETIHPNEALHIGMDFNVAHGAAVVHVLRGDEPHAVAELTEVFDTPAMIALLNRDYPEHPIFIYPDASGNNRKSNNASESDISLLKAARFRVCVNPANPAVKDRVLSMNRMLHNEGVRRYRVNPQHCPHLVESLEKQAYNKNGEPDKEGGLDHICFSASTLVTTENGVVRFDEIEESGRVIGPFGEFVDYKNAKKTGNKITVRVELASGYVIECTNNHLFLTRSGEWVQAQYLTGLECVLLAPQSKRSMGLNTIFAGNIFKKVMRQARSVYTELCGCFMQAMFQTSSIFTILMGIGLITRLKISHALMVESTSESTLTREKTNLQKLVGEVSQAQKHGTHQTMALSGIKNIIYPCLENSTRHIKKFAHAVVSVLKQKSQSKTSLSNSVQEHVRHIIDGRLELTTLLESAFHADQSSRLTGTVQGSVVKRVFQLGTQDVYCLTVPDYGCFKLSKDSPIVSNCDATGYFISYKYPIVERTAIVSSLRI